MPATMAAALIAARDNASARKVDGKKERAQRAAVAFAGWEPNTILSLQRITAARCPGLPWADVEEAVAMALAEVMVKPRHDLTRPPGRAGTLPLFGLVKHLAYWRAKDTRRRMEFRNDSLERMITSSGDARLPEDDLRMREISLAGLEMRLLCQRIRHLLDNTLLDTAAIAHQLGVHKWVVLYVRREHRQGGSLRKQPPKWTRTAIVAALQRIAEEKGRPPGCADMSGHSGVHDPNIPSISACELAFGSWVAAKNAAGFYDQPPPTDRECALKIRAWFLDNHRWPSAADYRADDNLPSVHRVIKLFGTSSASVVGEKVEALLREAPKSTAHGVAA